MTSEAGPPDRQHASPVGTWYEDHCPGGEKQQVSNDKVLLAHT